MTVSILSDTACTLGEGPLWHPTRESLFWFDILSHRLYEHDGKSQRSWQFDRAVSAAGWVDDKTLLVATERDLIRFDLMTGAEQRLVALEADNPVTRSNDGRADPFGGFWIGTMGFHAEPGAGAIYRYHDGALRKLFDAITISNAICFAPDGRSACFTDTPTRIIHRVALDAEGWPVGTPEPYVDLREAGLNPDGAVIDAAGQLWVAQWGASRVACYDRAGAFRDAVEMPAAHISCPAFGGPDYATLFATSALQDAPADDTRAGQTFAVPTAHCGQREHRVTLPPEAAVEPVV
ncbi:SMP-30/gluconolactonase/LRE family protein [Cognatishimia sp. F0-27]|uniref:SMP-30/gluconolactonase/LRE family protein n=1 Tax=Cognatishimia sp. F0-27 TaxID=2816855 RepID=UPI001D0C997E|nr:SMP-30/gluconolactonase/LRE family protein [Cognatishimia sp. F0-27]MCC1494845.1 SMP-30/gluconolactonase/LRE family protein [Cognatishimia sp. F0-27]